MAVIAAEWRAVRRVFGCRRDLRSCVSLIMSTGDAYRPFWHDLHFNAAWSFQIAVVRARDRTSANRIQGGLSAKPVDGDLTQPTLSAPKWAAAIAAPVAESSPH